MKEDGTLVRRDGLDKTAVSWIDHLLGSPLNTLRSSTRAAVVAACALLTTGWAGWHNGDFRDAWPLPDVGFYMDMARGRFDLVPSPFSARPLSPLLARWLAALGHLSLHGGFIALAYLSLLWSLLVVFWLLTGSRAPRLALLVVAVVPYWPQVLGYTGLPDPLYFGLLASLLLALEGDRIYVAAAMMLPLMLARESTWLALLCLLLVCWRRMRWGAASLAVACAVAGALIVRRLGAHSLPNPEHLPGSLYMTGKVVSNFARSLGIGPWSNVYPELCRAPVWQHALHLGTVHAVGVCSWSATEPLQSVAALCTVFGALPAVLVPVLVLRRIRLSESSALLRFCLLYGGISFLLAPTLGTWYARLFGYAWPLLLVAVPVLAGELTQGGAVVRERRRTALVWGVFLVVHLVTCAFGNRLLAPWAMASIVLGQVLWIALFLVQQRPRLIRRSAA